MRNGFRYCQFSLEYSNNGSGMEQAFFARDAATVAEELLGCILIRGDCRGRIVETEAYYGEDDPASHAYNGETERNKVMFGPAGKSYVYVCYGIHHMLNVTTGAEGVPEAVLFRAVEPVEGVNVMRERRNINEKRALCNGPGKLCEAFGVMPEHNDIDLTQGDFRIVDGSTPENIVQTTRIGVSGGEEMELRFYDADSDYVSER